MSATAVSAATAGAADGGQSAAWRLPGAQARGARVDEGRPLGFSVDGRRLQGLAGDTVASALLANGSLRVGDSIYEGRPRGVLAAWVEDPNALLTVRARHEGYADETSVLATRVELVDGLVASTLSGLGRLDPDGDGAIYDHKHLHTEVLVIGAGPAGLAAAREAARSGARVVLLDDQSEPGGQLLTEQGAVIDGVPAREWIDRTLAELHATEDVLVLSRTTATGSYDANYVVAVQRRTDHLEERPADGVSRERVWHFRAAQVIVATGAQERPLVFANNDRPGILLAGAVRTYRNRYGVAIGRRLVIATTNDSAYELAEEILAGGEGDSSIVAVVDARPAPARAAALRERGVRVITGAAVADTGADGEGLLASVTVAEIDELGRITGGVERIEADALAVSGGWSPLIHLLSQRQRRLAWSDALGAFVPGAPVAGEHTAGAVGGALDLASALADGARAGAAAAGEAGFTVSPAVPQTAAVPVEAARALWVVSPLDGDIAEHYRSHFVDLHRDQTVADVLRATGAGLRSVEHVKRYTSVSTGADQGKISSLPLVGVIARLLGVERPQEIGITAFRPPYTPISFAALAGRRRGELFDPARITSIHSWHLAHGAEFEDVGQWKRPWYYPQPGEDLEAAVLRETAAVRNSVGFLDASTLGKIEIRGKDAGEFLDRIYTNAFKKLAPGKIRYGVQVGADGFIFDDGTTFRLDDDRYLATTTTGGAAKVLDWLEEWHQTEWPQLDVVFTSVTEQWATVAVVGPRSREVIAKLAPGLDVSKEGFEFMAFRDATLASGIPARIARISFSGELAFEINVAWWYGLRAWEDVAAAGEEFGITPYGTETMHVLRAEKGFIIVGQDTDGTVTPQDAGMDWVVSKRKDFVGNRSFTRPDNVRADRKHLVSVLPVDTALKLPEGAQLIAEGTPTDQVPVPSEGWVTSSYHSAALGRSFGLALITQGRDRIGETLRATVDGGFVDVVVAPTVLFDPEGSRRDG